MVGAHAWLYALVGTVPLLLCAVLVLGHRKFTALSRRQIAATFAIHFTRCLLVLAVEFGLWELSGALPSAVACLQFVALRLVVTRLPLVPNKDLIFVGAGIAAAGVGQGVGDAGGHGAGDPGGGGSDTGGDGGEPSPG